MTVGRALIGAASLLSLTAAAAAPSAEQATRAALARIAKHNPQLHAVLAVDPTAIAEARALDHTRRARGLLFGRPVLIKDNIDVRGLPTTAGSLALIANVRATDAPLVAKLRASGAVIIGKANLSEWANFRSTHSNSGWSAIGGQTRNPRDLARSPCGSSSGSAAAVASGMVDLAIGTETDGSVTCPAAMTGIVGLKPTLALVSGAGIVPISPAQDTAGPMARSVRDVALLLAAMAEDRPEAARADFVGGLEVGSLKGARIGVLRFDTGASPGADALFEQALALMRARGAVLVEIAASGVDLGDEEGKALRSEFPVALEHYLRSAPPAVRTRTLADLVAFNRRHADRELAQFGQETFLAALNAPAAGDPATLAMRARLRQRAGPEGIDRLLAANKVEALIAPTQGPAVPIDPVNGDRFVRGFSAGSLAAVAGYPHLTVPMGDYKGLPVGLSFIGPAWSDARLLALGFAYETARRR